MSSPRDYDVIVSFSNDAMTESFIPKLFKRLQQVGISYFKEKDGKKEAIQLGGVAIALVMFSENYVNFKPCLEELEQILECKSGASLVVIPIFCGDRAGGGKYKKWRNAIEAQNISGYEWSQLTAACPRSEGSSKRSEPLDIIVERLVKEIHSLYSEKHFGPFGGKGSEPPNWTSEINGIAVEYGNFIKSIDFQVDPETDTKPQHGGSDRRKTYKVKLENGEYITSFAGYIKDEKFKSLTFRTNKRIWGTIGRVGDGEDGEYFSVPSKGGKVTELYGRSNNGFLESIGARVQLRSKGYYPVQSVGLFGIKRENRWDDGYTHANVKKIVVQLDPSNDGKKQEGRFIRSIAFTYVEKRGNEWQSPTHGNNTRRDMKCCTIKLGADEYLTSISGYYTNDGITSLTFLTNKKMIRTIGDDEMGEHFSSLTTHGKIVGFYGCIDDHLCGIGAYFEPIVDLYPAKSIGPYGGGNAWDDGKFDGVRNICLCVPPDKGIKYIQFVYDDGSAEGRKVTHPNIVSHSPHKEVKLDYPREYLTSISGYMQKDGSISSLTFYSNKSRFPFGKPEGEYFCSPPTGSRIIGFYGTWGETLNSIGVYVEPIPHLYPFKIVGPSKGSGGNSWNDGMHANVVGFRVTISKLNESSIIESITFRYINNGSVFEGSRHGGGDPSSGEWEKLDYPKERLTKIEGYTRKEGETGPTIIQGMTIYTTRRKGYYGPYAAIQGRDKEKSKHFEFPKQPENGRIIGFYGTAGTRLNSIGAYLD